MPPYFTDHRESFSLLRAGDMPLRAAQLGALHAIASHFSKPAGPALVVLPTGLGKTAIAQAIPFVLEDARRVLVVVPSKVLRSDAAERFSSLSELTKTSLVSSDTPGPSVHELTSRPESWAFAENCDVVIATPQSASPTVLANAGRPIPQPDLFDVVIVDEGHHVPATTWRSLVDHFADARRVLLTATPYRRDKRDVPGAIAYEYSLELAIAEGAYSSVALVPVAAAGRPTSERDAMIAAKSVERLRSPEHEGSALLIRTETRQRSEEVTELYRDLGVNVSVVHSGLTAKTVRNRLKELKAGQTEAISFVGILGEGFDHSALKIGAYHDKHKSLPATLQFIGRLARQTAAAGPAEVVTVVEDLEADTWELYRHDAVWAELIPELADSATQGIVEAKALVSQLPEPPSELSLYDLEPKRKGVVYELPTDDWVEPFTDDAIEALGLVEGAPFGSGRIYYVAANPTDRMLFVITAHGEHPPWMRSRGFDATTYQLHMAVAEPAQLSAGSPVTYLFVSSSTRTNERNLADLVGGESEPRLADPEVINRCMEAFEFEKYQGVGLRAVGPKGAGRASYRNLLGSGVDAAVRAADTRGHRLGHAMGTASKAPGKARSMAGVSTVNARIFESSYTPISGYIEWIGAVASIIRGAATTTGSVPLIPSLRFETRLHQWPASPVLGAELPSEAHSAGYDIENGPPLDRVSVGARLDGADARISVEYQGETIWTGSQDLAGRVIPLGPDRELLNGFLRAGTLSQFFHEFPPTIFFSNGAAVTGTRVAEASVEISEIDPSLVRTLFWRNVDITRELRTDGSGPPSVQDYVQRFLLRGTGRYVVLDDGSGELADYLVVEECDDSTQLTFVHCKASSEPREGLRLDDLIVVLDQCRRSARWIQQGPKLWDELARRLNDRQSTVVLTEDRHGRDALMDLCQRFAVATPRMEGTIVAAQPGLDVKKLLAASGAAELGSPSQGVIETIMNASYLVQSAAIRLLIVGS